MYAFFKNFLFISLPAIAIVFLFGELLVFRIIIPATQFPIWYFDPQEHILKYDISARAQGLRTLGPFAMQKTHFRINNEGWNSEIDFDRRSTTPLIAVVGDSFIEGFSVDPDNSLSAYLRKMFNGRYEIYRFGVAGSHLAQYLNVSRYVGRVFKPRILVISVVHNDFDEMIASATPKYNKGMLYLDLNNGKVEEKPIIPFRGSLFHDLIDKSALLRYVYFNCELGFWYNQLRYYSKDPGSTRIDKYSHIFIDRVKARQSMIADATDYVVARIASENQGRTVIFMMDGTRTDIYKDTLEKSEISWLNKLLDEKCKKYNVHFLDLTDHFYTKYKSRHIQYETELDGHWNAYGHETVAEALYDKISGIETLQGWP